MLKLINTFYEIFKDVYNNSLICTLNGNIKMEINTYRYAQPICYTPWVLLDIFRYLFKNQK